MLAIGCSLTSITEGTKKTHLVKTLEVSLVNTEEGSEQGNVQVVVTIPGRGGERVAKECKYLHKI